VTSPHARKAFYADLIERTVWTAAQAGAAALLAAGFGMEAAKVAGIAAILAIVKALAAAQLPWTAQGTASTLPAGVDPPVGAPRRHPLNASTGKRVDE
jgi:hypothetical protein